ncbi:MAG: aminotransferase class I/II-fold pyridoxal phosphate-dependent enzyme [Candidatus Lokiarchaeota archaeon]|nr:aminotransferase class I/II-fold pyridoxal phosphate-dependent enzyme [Candidatus Lokiarchaeota archaeon]
MELNTSVQAMLAKRNQTVPHSEIRKMYNMALERSDVLDLTAGVPDFDTPLYIKEAAKEAIDQGYTKYTHNAGLMEVRKAFAKKAKKDNGIDIDPTSQVICTAGGMGGLLLANMVLVEPGDEVMYPDPGFVSHYAHVKLAEGKPVPIQLKQEHDFGMWAEDIEELITDKTKLLVVNSPNNPTGGITTEDELRKIADLAIKHDFYVLSDEAYEKYYYTDEAPISIGSLPGMEERTISLFSLSKSYAMTGWRIGFATGPEEIIDAMVHLQEHVIAMPTSISQKAGQAAVEGPQDCITEMRETFTRRRRIMVEGLKEIEGINLAAPGGAFYAFPDVQAYGKKSWDLAIDILENTKVVTVHGSAFGRFGEGFLRLCYATSTERINKALDLLGDYLPTLLN